jgi:hypothetical protein
MPSLSFGRVSAFRGLIDDTLPDFIKRKHPKKGREKKKQTARTKVQARKNSPKEGLQQHMEVKGTTKVPKPPPVA